MTDPIEAMARHMLRERHPCWSIVAEIFDKASPSYNLDGQADEMRSLAAAAYAAQRETLVPVGWMVSHPDYDEPWVSLHPVSLVDPEDGYTVTPLYALPEIKP